MKCRLSTAQDKFEFDREVNSYTTWGSVKVRPDGISHSVPKQIPAPESNEEKRMPCADLTESKVYF